MGGLIVFLSAQLVRAQVPEYRFDPTWPQTPISDHWWVQGARGLVVDHEGLIWVLSRKSDITSYEDFAQRNPPAAECCVAAPVIVVFDAQGRVVDFWDSPSVLPRLHGLDVDTEGYVWIGADTVYKYTRDGQLIGSIPRAREDRAPDGGYPPATQAVVANIEDVRVDEDAGEVYLVDRYLNGRVMVYDSGTFEFKRGWGAYGKPLSRISMDAPLSTIGMDADELSYDPNGPPAQDFLGHVTLGLSDDGFVYVADRYGDRIQVFTQAGEFLKEFPLAPETLAAGSAGGIAFSEDAQQRYLLIPDLVNGTVWIVNRDDGTVLDRVGSLGPYPGQFHGLHMLDVDSEGNLYTGDVMGGKRLQRFLRVN